MSNLTVKEEVIADSLDAVAWLCAMDGVATNRIFVLGHSLGGTLAPRVPKPIQALPV